MENLDKLLEIVDNNSYALDSEDDAQAIWFNEVASGVNIELPSKILLSDGKVLNQGPTLLCVAYWTTAGVNEARNLFGFDPDRNPSVLTWYIEKNLDPKIRERGTYIVNGPKGARKLGWIEGFTQVNTLEDIKRSLAFGMPVATGTNKISWTATRKNNFIATPGKWGGHFINLVWYDDNKTVIRPDGGEYTGVLIVENSWGKKWGYEGLYYIPYDYALEVLFNTKKSIILSKNSTRKYAEKILNNLKKELEKKKITPVIQKYEFFNWENKAIMDQENLDLFKVLQNALKETGNKPTFRTIIGSNEDRTNTRLLIEINNARTKKTI